MRRSFPPLEYRDGDAQFDGEEAVRDELDLPSAAGIHLFPEKSNEWTRLVEVVRYQVFTFFFKRRYSPAMAGMNASTMNQRACWTTATPYRMALVFM